MLFKVILFSFFILSSLSAQDKQPEEGSTQEVVPDFSKIKEFLKNDNLEVSLEKKMAEKKKQAELKKKREYRKFLFPKEGDFWKFTSELWLVKNAPAVKWDFEKPDYGLEPYFQEFLETLGYYEIKFHVLLVDTPNVTHFALPTKEGEFLALLSVPFIRTLNLSKLEISLILFEDFIRNQNGYFKNYAHNKDLKKLLGKNFKKDGFDKEILTKVLKKYDSLVFDKGFNFQQQFETTKKVSMILKSNMKIWNAYYMLIGKINDLVGENLLYKNYTKIYPSPELQLGWLKPKN